VVEAPEQPNGFANGKLLRKPGLLKRNADALAQRFVVFAPCFAEDSHLTRGGGPEPFQDFDRGGLAGAVGSEKAEAFSCLNLKRDTTNGSNVRGVDLLQVLARDDRCGRTGRFRWWLRPVREVVQDRFPGYRFRSSLLLNRSLTSFAQRAEIEHGGFVFRIHLQEIVRRSQDVAAADLSDNLAVAEYG